MATFWVIPGSDNPLQRSRRREWSLALVCGTRLEDHKKAEYTSGVASQDHLPLLGTRIDRMYPESQPGDPVGLRLGREGEGRLEELV